MGQKTHPIGFRLGVVKPWSSRWYASKDMPALLKEDELIRKYLKARLGGDEFAILCPKLQSEDDLEQFCARLLGAVASIPSDDTPGCRLGGSIGIACYPRDGYALDHLLALADRAMYAAKNAGGHRWQVA